MSYELKSCWLPAAKYPLKAPYPMTPEGLIVHNTAGSASAMEEAQAMCTNDSAVSFHVVIDEENAVECIPFSRNAFHAGDGAQGFANRHLIGLEIARSMDAESDRFDRAEANAAEYIAHVCLQYGCTSAQLVPEKKNELSHRGEGLRKMREILLKKWEREDEDTDRK